MSTANTARKILIRPNPPATAVKRWLEWITPPPSQAKRWSASVLLTAGAVLLTVVFFIIIAAMQDFTKKLAGSWGSPMISYVMLMIGGYWLLLLYRFARRMRARHALQALKKDKRAPILLLRAFRDDYYPLPDYQASFFVAKLTRTFEEFLHDKLSKCAPVIAIGRPGEQTPPLGAPRFWVADDKWKQVVRDLLIESQYVIMIMGDLHLLASRTPLPIRPPGAPPAAPVEDGLTWEVREVFGMRDIQKVILLMPPVPENEAYARWEQYRVLSRYRMPPFQGGELAAVFAADGVCWVMRAKMETVWFQKGYRRRLASYTSLLEVKV